MSSPSTTLRLTYKPALAGLRVAAVPLALAAAAVLVRIPFFSWPMISDEGGYAYTTSWWLRGLTLYSDQLWFDRPQGIFVAYVLPVLLGGDTWIIRIWGALWGAGTAILVYLIARHLFSERTALISALICALASASPQIEGFTANAELFALLPATASAYCLLTRRFALAGLLASLAFLLKPSSGSIALLGFAWLVYQRRPSAAFIRYGLAGLPLPLLAVAHGAVTVGLDAYLYAVIGFRSLQVEVSAFPNLIRSLWVTGPAWLSLAVLGLLVVRQASRTAIWFCFIWIGSAIVGMAMGRNWSSHYWIQIIPPLSALAGAGLARLFGAKRPVPYMIGLCAIVLPLLAAFPYANASPASGSWQLYHRPGYQIAGSVAEYVRSHTTADETIYVAFAESDIYHLAGRRSAAPNLFRLELLYLPGAYDRVIQAISEQRPSYVLALDSPETAVDPEGRFWWALERGYEVETTFDGVPLYRRK